MDISAITSQLADIKVAVVGLVVAFVLVLWAIRAVSLLGTSSGGGAGTGYTLGEWMETGGDETSSFTRNWWD